MKPIAIICCWRCKNKKSQLFRCVDKEGNKTDDYVCNDCKDYVGIIGPEIGNQSQIYFKKEHE